MKHQFDGIRDRRDAPRHFIGHISTTMSRISLPPMESENTIKKAIHIPLLWELSYWKDLAVHHSINGMHVNFFCVLVYLVH